MGYRVGMSEGVSEGRRMGPTDEQPVEMRRYLYALRRSWVFIVVFVVAITALAVVGSSQTTKRYRTTATVVAGNTLSSAAPSDVASVQRQLETIQRLGKTNDVVDLAVSKLPGQTRGSVDQAVSFSVDPSANIINISSQHSNPGTAAAIANAVAAALLTTQSVDETKGVANAKAKLQLLLARLRATGAAPEELQAIRDRISELVIAQASIGTDLRLAQPAAVPTSPYTPRPVRNGFIAFFAAAFLAVLIALGRDLFRPRISESRELAQLTNLPILARIPFTRKRFGRSQVTASTVAEETYQTLQASLQYAHQGGGKIVVVTSALEKEGKTTTAVGIAQALARTGQKTLLICADFRFPTLHEHFGLARSPGLADLLRTADSPASAVKEVRRMARTVAAYGTGRLEVIPSGSHVDRPAELLFGGAFDALVTAFGLLDYDQIVIDGPPMLGIADGHALVQRADSVLLVARPDRLTVDQVIDVRDRLERLHANTLGLVVLERFHKVHAYGYAYARMASGGPADGSDLVDQVAAQLDSRRITNESAAPLRQTGEAHRPK